MFHYINYLVNIEVLLDIKIISDLTVLDCFQAKNLIRDKSMIFRHNFNAETNAPATMSTNYKMLVSNCKIKGYYRFTFFTEK